MFTGIIETKARILEKTDEGLVIERPRNFTDVKIGTSICVDGACLSIVGLDETMMAFDVVPETWSRTKLGTLKEGDLVNLERSLAAGDRFEGHVVQGHVEGVGTVVSNGIVDGGGWMLIVELPPEVQPSIIFKGSIAIEGVSLTVAALDDELCSVALIPHTLEVTTLGKLRPGDRVNIESDMFLRGLQHMLLLKLKDK